jgi:hypothetical protein
MALAAELDGSGQGGQPRLGGKQVGQSISRVIRIMVGVFTGEGLGVVSRRAEGTRTGAGECLGNPTTPL